MMISFLVEANPVSEMKRGFVLCVVYFRLPIVFRLPESIFSIVLQFSIVFFIKLP